MFFVADDGVHGAELWKSDGTEPGTSLVKDILTGSVGSSPSNLTAVNGSVFFTADDGIHGIELWKSDGTAAGTSLVRDIYPGSTASLPTVLVNANGTLLFRAEDGTHGVELWKSDGTVSGTELLKDIAAGSDSSNPHSIAQPTTGSYAIFVANNGTSRSIWRTDGTAGGTLPIHSSIASTSSAWFTNSGLNVYFVGNDGSNGDELWALPLSAIAAPTPTPTPWPYRTTISQVLKNASP